MKKTYQKPAIELFTINAANLAATSIDRGDDFGDGKSLDTVESKRSSLDDDDDEIAAGW